MNLPRLLSLIFADILLAAHFLRFSGLFPAALVLLCLATLFIRRAWVIWLWRVLMFIATLVGIDTVIKLIRPRLALHLRRICLTTIMVMVTAFRVFTTDQLLLWASGVMQNFYQKITNKKRLKLNYKLIK